jgi:perosamine synthetase
VSSGTSALEIILRALRIRDAEVVVPTNTFAATAFAVLHSGNRVVLADVDEDLFLDPSDLARRLTKDTKAVIAVHIGGRIVPAVEQVREICEDKGIALIEDAAHAHGSRLEGRAAGSFGVAAAFSFYPTKVMTSGEGGMVVTDDERLAAACRVFRDQGKAGFTQNLHTELGSNWRLSEIHAAIGLSQLRRLWEFVEGRREAAKVYDEGLGDADGLRVLREGPGMRSNYYKYIAVPPAGTDRAQLKARLKKEHGISLSGEVYEVPLHGQPVFQDLHVAGARFPVAEDLCSRHICLPIYATMTREEAGFVVDAIREVWA